MIGKAIFTGIVGYAMLFVVMTILVLSVKWMIVLNLLERAKKRKSPGEEDHMDNPET